MRKGIVRVLVASTFASAPQYRCGTPPYSRKRASHTLSGAVAYKCGGLGSGLGGLHCSCPVHYRDDSCCRLCTILTLKASPGDSNGE